MLMGESLDPQQPAPPMNLPQAKEIIDILSMLEEKTKGNLSSDEASVYRRYAVYPADEICQFNIRQGKSPFLPNRGGNTLTFTEFQAGFLVSAHTQACRFL